MERQQVVYYLRSLFSLNYGSDSVDTDYLTTLGHPDVSRFFEISTDSNTYSIPIIHLQDLHRYRVLYRGENIRIVIPIYPRNPIPIVVRSYETFVKQLSLSTRSFTKVCDKEGNIYYIGKGVVLDKDYSPLFIPFVNFNTNYIINSVTIKISPKVFINNTRCFEKGLIHKIIPLFLTNPISYFYLTSINTPITPNIVIEDISGYVKTVPPPENDATMDEDLNNFLLRRVNNDFAELE